MKRPFLTTKGLLIFLFPISIFLIIILATIIYENKKMHNIVNNAQDLLTYGHTRFYSNMREEYTIFEQRLQDLKNKKLNQHDKEKLRELCIFKTEDGINRIEVAKAYDCLLQLYPPAGSNLYKAIKNGSYSLETFYTENAAINLSNLIISGYEQKIPEDLIKAKYYTGYTKDEIEFLEKLLALAIPELSARCLYRLSLIHTLGRASSKETHLQPNFKTAIQESKTVQKLSGIKQENILDIAIIINDKFAVHAAVTIASALLNADLDSFYRFHIIMNPDDPVSLESQQKMASMSYIKDYAIDFINFPNELIPLDLIQKKMKLTKNWPLLVNYRLYLDKVFPELDSILYLDSDTIILRDLLPLKKIDLTNYMAAAVTDFSIKEVIFSSKDTACKHELPNFYKNSGVVFFNLTYMRHMDVSSLLIKTINDSHCKFEFPDQDLLNIAFYNYIYPLSARWNLHATFDYMNFSPFIIHYAGPPKPWAENFEKLWQEEPNELKLAIQDYWWYREVTAWKVEK